MDLDRIDQEVRKLMHWRDSMTGPVSGGPAATPMSASDELADAFAKVEATLKDLGDALVGVDTRLNGLEARINEIAALVQTPAAPPTSPPEPAVDVRES